jgi:signal transduction histidine kinase/ligand-binding sensor domain-containing protein
MLIQHRVLRLLLCLLLALWPTGGVAQTFTDFPFATPHFESVGDGDVIPHNIVTALVQDAKGMLWIGTQQGLVRYDGQRFRKFMHVNGDLASLSDDYITCLWATTDGRVWAGTSIGGVTVFDPASEQFSTFRHDPAHAKSISEGRVWAMVGDQRGGMWIGTDQGLDYLPPSHTGFTHFRHDPANPASLYSDRVRSLLLDRQHRLWVGTSDGVQRLAGDGKAMETVVDGAPDNLTGHTVLTLFEAQDGKIWLGTREFGAAWLAPGTKRLHWLVPDQNRPDRLSHAFVHAIVQMRPDSIWLATRGGGINIVSAHDGAVLQQLHHDPSVPGALALDDIGALWLDQAGLLWVGNWGGGLQRHNTNNRAFRSLHHSLLRNAGLSNSNIRSLLELPDGTILVGTSGNGIDILDRQRGVVGGYRVGSKAQGGLPDGTILALARSSDGTLWAGTRQNGALYLAPGRKEWQEMAGLSSVQVNSILISKSGEVWASGGGGVGYWRSDLQRFETCVDAQGKPMLAIVYSMLEDRQGRIWIASDAGLWLAEPGTHRLRGFFHEAGRADSLSADRVLGLLSDRAGQLWVDTGLGLERLHSLENNVARFEHMSAQAGRPGLYLGGNLLEDRQGRIWTQWYVLDWQARQVMALSRADGFDIGTGWLGAYLQLKDGRFLFGGTRGLVIVEADQFRPWLYQPPLAATELKIDGKAVALGALTPGLSLTAQQRNFGIEFAALDFSGAHATRYRYRLRGYETEWIETDAGHRDASYGNLWPGQYALQVRGTNRVGQWSPHELLIPIVVLPAFWQTSSFLLAVLAALAVLAYAVHRWRLGRVRAKAQVLERQVAARTADILQLSEIGGELTATLDIEQAFERVYRHVRGRLDAFVFGIGIYEEEVELIRFDYEMENDRRLPSSYDETDQPGSPSAWSVLNRRELVVGSAEQLRRTLHGAGEIKCGAGIESMIYLPLIAEHKVIGCLTVQSPKKDAYNSDQLEFLRVLANYTAIAISNSEAHGRLAEANLELAAAHVHMQETQQQLVLQEKMASLGQLVANVAHEINTPISAIKASGRNIVDALAQALGNLPGLLQRLDMADRQLFLRLIGQHDQVNLVLDGRTERAITRTLLAELEQAGLAQARYKAGILVQLRAHTEAQSWLPLLRHAEADLILETARNLAIVINNANNINTAVDRVSKIVFALKSFSRIDVTSEVVWANLQEGVETALTIYSHQIRQGTELLCDYEPLPAIPCFPDQLNQVWLNLIHNALQAMAHKGTLSIRITRVGEAAMVAVGDTGCGIAPEMRERIFDPFFTTKPTGEGSGLGLDIVKRIVDKHRGKIELDSEVGKGTTFRVYLPLSLPDDGLMP